MKKRFLVWGIVLLLPLALLFTACSSSSSSGSKPEIKSIVFTQEVKPGVTIDRVCHYYIPTAYKKNNNIPVLFSFHGTGLNGLIWACMTGVVEEAEKQGFIAVIPSSLHFDFKGSGASQTIADEDIHCGSDYLGDILSVLIPVEYHDDITLVPSGFQRGTQRWNTVPGGTGITGNIKDLEYFDILYEHFVEDTGANKDRVYVEGMSNGSGFSTMLAAKRSNLLAGVGLCLGGGENAGLPAGERTIQNKALKVVLYVGTADIAFPNVQTTVTYYTNQLGITRHAANDYGAQNIVTDWRVGPALNSDDAYLDPILDRLAAEDVMGDLVKDYVDKGYMDLRPLVGGRLGEPGDHATYIDKHEYGAGTGGGSFTYYKIRGDGIGKDLDGNNSTTIGMGHMSFGAKIPYIAQIRTSEIYALFAGGRSFFYIWTSNAHQHAEFIWEELMSQ